MSDLYETSGFSAIELDEPDEPISDGTAPTDGLASPGDKARSRVEEAKAAAREAKQRKAQGKSGQASELDPTEGKRADPAIDNPSRLDLTGLDLDDDMLDEAGLAGDDVADVGAKADDPPSLALPEIDVFAPMPPRRPSAQRQAAPRPKQPQRPPVSRVGSQPGAALGSSPNRRRAVTAYEARREPLESQANPDNLRSVGMHGSSYRIRGGGLTQGKHPVAYVVIGLIVALAISLGGLGAWRLIGVLATGRIQESAVTITVDQGHQALTTMPRLPDYIWVGADDAFNQMTEAGIALHLNDRMTSKNPDGTAHGKEIVYLPEGATPDDLSTYNAGEFDGFDLDEMQGRMLGSWMLDISSGDRGSYLQFKYVNLATHGLSEEMHWLLGCQGLSGDNTVVVDEGVDVYGNNYVQGYSVIDGDRTVYWRVLSCSFSAYYRGSDNRSLPESSSYVKLVVATWDFYGVDKTPPD
jgi:hypothetical protein